MSRIAASYCIGRGLVATAFACGSGYACIYGTGWGALWLGVAALFAMPHLSTSSG